MTAPHCCFYSQIENTWVIWDGVIVHSNTQASPAIQTPHSLWQAWMNSFSHALDRSQVFLLEMKCEMWPDCKEITDRTWFVHLVIRWLLLIEVAPHRLKNKQVVVVLHSFSEWCCPLGLPCSMKSQFSLRKWDLTMNSEAVHVPCSKNYHIKYYTG